VGRTTSHLPAYVLLQHQNLFNSAAAAAAAGKPHTPDVSPTTSHLPTWNSMAMFVVQPGRSFHSVQVRRYIDSTHWM
jgi:hypothetical protein